MALLATLSDAAQTAVTMMVLVGSFIAAYTAFQKIGPERETSTVNAQDTVIDNLREEIDRQRREREADMADMRRRLNVEREECDRKINELASQVAVLTTRLNERSTS